MTSGSPRVTASAPPPLPEALACRPAFLLAKAHARAHDIGARALRPYGLSLKHYGCLKVVADQGPVSQQALGELMRVDRTTIVLLVDELECSGYVLRRRNPRDRRAYALEVTDAGRALLLDAERVVGEAENEIFSSLDVEERERLVELLRKVLAASL